MVPSAGSIGRVAAVLVADRPRAADVVGLGVERVVLAFAERAADRMDRRQIDDVEAELRDARQRALGIGERAVPPGLASAIAGNLVPGRERARSAVHHDLELAIERRRSRGATGLRQPQANSAAKTSATESPERAHASRSGQPVQEPASRGVRSASGRQPTRAAPRLRRLDMTSWRAAATFFSKPLRQLHGD